MPGASAGHNVYCSVARIGGAVRHLLVMMVVMPVMTMMTVVRRLAHVVTLVDAEHSFDAADHAANRGADDRTDRAGDTVALIEAMRSAAGNALRLSGERHRKHCEKRTSNKQVLFHEVISISVEEHSSV
jgi:hypothetical protein